MSTTLKVLSAKKVIASHQINQGDTLVIDARDKSNYQLIDDQTGFAPQNIIAKREGKDLKIFLEDGDMNPDVVIKGYYGDENSEEVTNLLVGQHENGGVYAYVPESGLKADAVSMLAEEVAAPQALGGEDLASAFWAFNPWWLLALVPLAAGIAIAASSGGSSGGSSNNGNNDTTADKPGIKANNDGSVTVTPGSDNTKVNVTFKDENGKDKTVTAEKGADGKWSIPDAGDTGATIDPDTGVVTIPSENIKDGSTVTATGTDDKGNTATNTGTVADSKPGDSNGDGVVDDKDDSTEIVTLPGGKEVPRNTDGAPNIVFGEDENNDGYINAKEIIGKDGKDTTPVYITIPEKTEVGDTLVVTVNGKEKSIPVTPEMIEKGFTQVDVPVNGDGPIEVTAKVTDPAGQSSNESNKKVEVDTGVPGDTDGNGTPDKGDNSKDKIEVPIIDKDGNETPIKVDKNNNGAPNIIFVEDRDGNDVLNKAEIGDDNSTPVHITIPDKTKAGDTLVVTINGKEQKIPVTEEMVNKGYTTVQVPVTQDGEIKVTAKVVDPAGNESATGEEAVTVDTSEPTDPADKPTIESPDNDGKVTVTPGEDNTKVEVTFKGEDDQPKTVVAEKGDDGKWSIPDAGDTGATVDPDTGVITIPSDKVKDGEPVNAKGTNDAGNTADADTVNAGTDAEDPADKPTIESPDNDGKVTVTPGEDNTKVEVTFKGEDDQPKTVVAEKGDDGKWSIPDAGDTGATVDPDTGVITIPSDKVKDGEPVNAKGTNDAGNTADADTVNAGTDAEDPADKPTIESPDNDGKVTVTPGEDNTKVEVTFKGEDDQPKTVVAEKGDDGKWSIPDAGDTGATVDPDTGVITIPSDKVKDGEPVNAKGTNDAGNTADADTVNAGTDPKDASVDNTNGDGVVSTTPANEGDSITTTVKLTNNNGNEKLPFSLPNGTADGELGESDFADKSEFTFSNGVTLNPDGTLNVPAGVTEFTITTPVKEDNKTEGEEKGKFKVGNVDGNEVTVNDTSKQDAEPKIDIDNIAGQAQVAEGTEGYAQFLPSNIATEEISNTTESGVTKVVKGFAVKGTTTGVPTDTEVEVTIAANGETYFTGKAKVAADGTWEVKVPTSTVTTTVTGTGEDETTEVTTEFNNPKFDTAYDITAKVTVNGTEATDTDKTEAAPVVTDIYLQDKLTDDAPNVTDFYTDTDKYVGRIDGMADTDATKAISRQTGLTNDPSAELHFTLDKEPKSGQVVKVLRYTIVDGNEGRVEDLTDQMTNNGLDYTVKPTTPQAETTNALYRYKVVVEDANGADLSEKVFNYRLDTIVEAMDVKELNADTNTMIIQADGVSEIGATIKYKYHNGTGETGPHDATDNGDGTYTLNLANWNRKVAGSITIQVIDAAGNVSETKVNAVRNLFNDYTLEKGLNPNGNNFDDPLITGLSSNVGGQSASLVADNPQTFAATDGNDTLIIGLDNFGGMGVGNGSVGRGIYIGGTDRIEMGAGDDHIQVRGTLQSMGTAREGYFDMGEGNDKITFGGTFLVGTYTIRMGEGNNVLNFGGTTVQVANFDISYGDGNDVLRADTSKDFAGNKTISFGNGDNYMEVGVMHDKNEITFGNGNDVFIAKSVGTKAPASGVIDMGDGDDTFSVSGLFARQEAKLGAGDDVAIMGDKIETGAAYGRLDGGDGNDTLVLTKSDGKVSLQNVLNFEVIDLTAPTAQTIGIKHNYVTQTGDTTKVIYINGGTNDVVDFGDNGTAVDGKRIKDSTDGGLLKADWNYWEKTGENVHDGISYDKYTYRAKDGSVDDEVIYVQQGIQII